MRPLFFILGWLFFGLGFVGAFLPVLPTTPFMLLALWCFSRSSDRFHNWLYTHKLFGPPLQQWQEHRVIPLATKAIALFFMTASLIYVFVFSTVPDWARICMAASMAFGAGFILTKPSTPPKGQSPEKTKPIESETD
jgi:uncharacterized membrane protein YbaN (DUF454 family)